MNVALGRLATDLHRAADEVPHKVARQVRRACGKTMRDWRQNEAAISIDKAPYFPRSISYEVGRYGDLISGEVGPDKRKPQGPLGNILEFGSVNNPPHNSGGRAVHRQESEFVEGIARVASDFL